MAGDIAAARASVLAVNHLDGLAPAGAEAALDAVLGGAIARRAAAGQLGGALGATHFLPAGGSPLAAECVLVVGLGDPERFRADRLDEVGAAIVEACAAMGLRDAATILHGAGAAGVAPDAAARALVEGALEAIAVVPGGRVVRELAIVEREAAALEAAERGVRAARVPGGVHLYVERGEVGRVAGTGTQAGDGASVPAHLRLGVTRQESSLKLTVIGDGSMDWSVTRDYPTEALHDLYGRLRAGVLDEEDAQRRAAAMRSLGHTLFETLLADAPVDVPELLAGAPQGLVVLRLDAATVNLPWELLVAGDAFIARGRALARQVELPTPARRAMAAAAMPGERLRVLVIGDPDGDLPEARAEAEAVAALLDAEAGAEVEVRIGGVTLREVSTLLDTHDFDVLHYAGHAVYDELHEGAGGLALRGEVLAADDLRVRRHLPRVVVANACNAAQAGPRAPDPFEGAPATRDLVAGLLAGGAQAVVGSQWRIADAPARTFALALYEGLLDRRADGRREGIGEAVRRAREAVVATHGDGQPAWAAHALYGAPWRPAL